MPEGPEILYLSKICGKHLIGHKLIDIVSNTKHRIKLPIKSELKNINQKINKKTNVQET